MTDALIKWYDYGGDIEITNGDFQKDPGLTSAVLISLFTDARAPDVTALPEGEKSLRGWWGDIEDGQNTGSLLWLINRSKTQNIVAEKAREYCENALQWLIEDEIAQSVSVEPLLVPPFGLQIIITIQRGTARRYNYLWEGLKETASITIANTSIRIEFIE